MRIRKYMTVLILSFLLITIGTVSKADDADIVEAPGGTTEVNPQDVQENVFQFDFNDFENGNLPADNATISTSTDGENFNVDFRMEIPNQYDENGNVIPPTIDEYKFDKDALTDPTASNNYAADTWKNNGGVDNALKVTDAKIVQDKATGKYYLEGKATGTAESFDSQGLSLSSAQALLEAMNRGIPKEEAIKYAMSKNGVKPENKKWHKEHEDRLRKLYGNKKAIEKYIKSQKAYPRTKLAFKRFPPKQIVKKAPPQPGEGACDKWNALGQPAPVTCDDGTHQGVRAFCKVSNSQEPMGSYTTTTPDNSDPYIRNEKSVCDNQRSTYLGFSEIMNVFGNRTWSKDDLMNRGVSTFNRIRMQDQFANNPWKSSWRGEARKWNPFVKGNKVSGIGYNVLFSPLLDSWYDKEYQINSMITESINHKNKSERYNAQFTAKYGINDKLPVFLNAPDPKMQITALDLNNNSWNTGESSNIYCVGQYEMKVEPRYKILRWTRYRKYKVHKTTGPSYTYKCVCEKWEEYSCCKSYRWEEYESRYCSKWGKGKCEEYDTRTRSRRVCDEWGTCKRCVRTEAQEVGLGGVNVKYPNGQGSSGPTPAGSIPPIYKQRRKYQYRIGAYMEYHAIARNAMNPRFRPVPDSYRDPSKIKAGYGFNYTSGMQLITDYDRDPRTYNASPVIIRPNKAVPLNIARNNYLGNYGRFNPNVRYNSATNAPERSSSINENFIEEDLRGRITRTTFNPNEISNVEKVDGKMKDLKDVEQLPVSPSVRRTPINWGERTTSFRIDSDPTKYYHAYWRTRGEENLVPAYRPGPLHYIYLDYLSGTDYTVGSLEFIRLNNRGFGVSAFNSGSIRVVGNMWEDSFSRPDFRKSRDFNI